MTRLALRLALVLLSLVGTVTVAAVPAQADPYPQYNCDWQYDTTYLAYYYAAGGYYVSAAEWHEYGTEASPDCDDINVEISNTGSMVIRTLVCPYTGSCYVVQPYDGWGSLSQFPGPSYGVTLWHQYMPCGGACAFRFQLETRSFSNPGSGVAENIKLTF